MKKILFSIFTLFVFVCAKAEIVLPKIFSDNMVLQRQIPVKIWGKAEANSVIGIDFAEQKIKTKVKKDGSWSLSLRPLKATDSPLVMKIYENGKLSKELKNILIGEVWVAGGQSNMQWSLEQINVLENDSLRGSNAMIRMFTQEHKSASKTPEFDSPEGAQWELCKTDNFRSFSAISFFFAEDLSAKLKVPVGIVQTSLGGSRMIPWIAEEDLAKSEVFAEDFEEFKSLSENYNYEEAKANHSELKKKFQADKKEAAKAKKKFTLKLPKEPNDLSPLPIQQSPSYLYNAKIAPIAGFTARGFIWYQGESDSYNPEVFAEKFEFLIRSWRKYWSKLMPFYFVQLASYGKTNDDWAATRWQQYLVHKKLRLVEMAVSIDTGDEKNIHPADKEEISNRLSRLAQKKIYGNRFMTGEYGPMLKNVVYDANKAVINFNLFGRKIVQKGDLRGFEVLIDGEWQVADSVELDVEKAKVTIVETAGKEIEAVRYLWKSFAKLDVSLFSDLDYPAMPFIDEKKLASDPLNKTPKQLPNKETSKARVIPIETETDQGLEEEILPVLKKNERLNKDRANRERINKLKKKNADL